MQTEEELVEIALFRYAHEQAAKWGADRFAAEFERRELEERWLEASKRDTTPYGPSADDQAADDGLPSGPVDASAQAAVVGTERDAWVLERPKHARHASVPRPPSEEPETGRKGWRHRRRERATTTAGWTISAAEAAGMSAAGRRLYGLDDPS
jgi:hypothetical protein